MKSRKSTRARRREKARCGLRKSFARSINNAGSHRWAHGARRQISFACLHVSHEPKRWVHGATKIKHAQVCEHMSRSFTRQHAAAHSCRADPSLPIIALAHLYYRKRNSFWDWSLLLEKRACGSTHSSESGCIRLFTSNTYCVSLFSAVAPSVVVFESDQGSHGSKGRSKPELENLEPRTQILVRF